MRIDIAQSAGPVAAGRSTAASLRSTVERTVVDEHVILDFSNVRVVAPSFADELVAKLAPGLLDDGQVVVEGANEDTMRLLELVRRRRIAA